MIRINLLPQQRPKTRRAAGPAPAAFQSIALLIGMLAGVGVLAALYVYNQGQIEEAKRTRDHLRTQKAELERVKAELESFRQQKNLLDQRIAVIQELQRNRIGGQELLDAVANTVVRTETLWLTRMERKGDGLVFEGTAASLTAVANFITQLQRSGFFSRVEIRESRQDEQNTAVETFLFTLSADFTLPGSQQAQQPAQQVPAGRPPAPAGRI